MSGGFHFFSASFLIKCICYFGGLYSLTHFKSFSTDITIKYFTRFLNLTSCLKSAVWCDCTATRPQVSRCHSIIPRDKLIINHLSWLAAMAKVLLCLLCTLQKEATYTFSLVSKTHNCNAGDPGLWSQPSQFSTEIGRGWWQINVCWRKAAEKWATRFADQGPLSLR